MPETITYQGIEFKDTTFVSSALLRIKLIIDSGEKFKFFDNERNFYGLRGGYYILEYTNGEKRNMDQELFKKIYQTTPNTKNKEIQTPKFCGEFEYQGKYYILLSAEEKENTIQNEYAHNGIIFNPQLFSQKFLSTQQDLLENLK